MGFQYLYFLLVLVLFDASFSKSTAQFGSYYDLDKAEDLFQEFIATHGKSYAHGEYDTRFNIFKTNLERINELNKRNAGQHTHGITSLTDMTPEEVIATKTGFILSDNVKYRSKDEFFANMNLNNIPDSFDWRNKSILNPVKSQGLCVSGWAFSAIAAIESRFTLKTKVTLILSEQQLIDCSSTNRGCDGGRVETAFEYLKTAGGSEDDAAYPYTSGDSEHADTCAFNPKNVQVKVTNHTEIQDSTEEQLKALVVEYGAVSIAFHAYTGLFTYIGGVARPTAEDCPSAAYLNHAANIVGYGEESGVKFWIIRNSWGTDWGEKGYFKLEIGKCRVGDYVYTAEVV